MSRFFLAVVLVTPIVVMAGATPSAAQKHSRYAAAPDRFCLQGRIWGYPGNCQFATYGQCAATASGTDAYCDVNPRYRFPPR
jgi:uncharacterized protein DUF3551